MLVLSTQAIFIALTQRSWRGVYWFYLVRPSVYLWTEYSPDPFHIYTSYQATSEDVFKIEKFEVLANSLNLWLWLGIQYELVSNMGNNGAAGVSSEPRHSSCSSCYLIGANGSTLFDSQYPFYQHGSSLTPAWINDHMPCKVQDEITYSVPNFNSCTIEVWEWISKIFYTSFQTPRNTPVLGHLPIKRHSDW